jgi:deoxycytidylate deaminase
MLSRSTLIRLALIEACLSDNRHRLGAVIYTKNIVLSQDHNYSLKSAKNLHPKYRSWPGSIHAEMAVILSAHCNLKGSNMFLLRINRKEDFLLSKPCSNCMSFICHVGIRRVTYSTNSGFETIYLR